MGWHPLEKYVRKVIIRYNELVFDDFELGRITSEEYLDLKEDFNFEHYLTYIYNNIQYDPVKDGLILDVFKPLNMSCKDDLVLFRYKSIDNELWSLYDGLYRECRSCVFETETGACVMAPQRKFFNVNEIDGWREYEIKERLGSCLSFSISDKLDGSNQNARWYRNKILLTGSVSLDPAQSWRLESGYKLFNENYKSMIKNNSRYTFMFEHITQADKHVVNYDNEGLYLFGMRDIYTGRELSFQEVKSVADEYNIPTPELCNTSFDTILSEVSKYKCDEKEGWVISIVMPNKQVFKAKLKVTDYVLMHHAISAFASPNNIVKAVAEDRIDDYLAIVPESIKQDVLDIVAQVHKYIHDASEAIWEALRDGNLYASQFEESEQRKQFFIWLTKNVKSSIRPYVANGYLGKPSYLLKKGLAGYKKFEELKL